MGGGMTSAYHRRITMHADDVSAEALTKLGSGANCLGYYIYKGALRRLLRCSSWEGVLAALSPPRPLAAAPAGGTNPEGVLSTMEESQVTGYSNDLQVKSYDYFAPIAEYGNVHGHYHSLRRVHAFVDNWGAAVAPLAPFLPELLPSSDTDTSVLRWAVRSDGRSGFVFVNNYVRNQQASEEV